MCTIFLFCFIIDICDFYKQLVTNGFTKTQKDHANVKLES